MTKYVEINGKRYDLDEDGHAYVGPHDFQLSSALIGRLGLGLEVKEDAPEWTVVSLLNPGQPLTYARTLGASQDTPEDYRTGLELLATYAGHFLRETFELRKDGVVVATLKGENV